MTDAPEYELTPTESDQLAELVGALKAQGESATEAAFFDRGWEYRYWLPQGLSRFLEAFRRTERAAHALIRGFPVHDAVAGPTPAHWKEAADSRTTEDQELLLGLCGLILGEPFTWATLQQGRLVQNVLPIPGDEHVQNGHGSESLLEFHTEDGFHPGRCDYLLLFGIRNPDRVPTILASVRDVELSPRHRQVLAEPRFRIRPDGEHVRQLAALDPAHPALALARRMSENPEPVAALFGDPERPYLRIDPPFMDCAPHDREAREALAALVAALEDVKSSVVVDSGTLLVLDNYMAVHGRNPFTPRYDGTDRWLKKLVVSRNLRAGLRAGSAENPRALF
ncbi:taurine catabolism dioxygenase TauD [Streptomyces sp. WAC07149]|uniref:guanitoxin biosynthesis L-enduracididine beta-hydroxylase GntD n=1 Tax=Streptomyces sp. WAC07149 TaxID=2487425 RepID=UPI000F79B723|nr:guanitoxin biosynthesis L-enduracididine beta-hydroxylase GntD [Streptomyces sp. WAC07149]RST08706.1 taurine catabolism dioxygenase TauD [Streptomyces sp. WAC07149]